MEEKVLNIYNWSDYIADDTIANFEKETGIKVRYDMFDNNEILHAKLVAGKTGYDIVVPSSTGPRCRSTAACCASSTSRKLPNLANLDPAIQAQLAKLDPGNQYLVNWLWGYTTVGINVDKVKAALGSTPMPDNAWDLVFKPEYISQAEVLRRVASSTRRPRCCRPRCTTWASRRTAADQADYQARRRPTC
jgi:putrescine transport system substrate-binding protein